MSLICKIFNHKYHLTRTELEQCDKWDDCNIKEHQMLVDYLVCVRCDHGKRRKHG